MSNKIDGSFIDFVLIKSIQRAIKSGVIDGDFINTEKEQCHVSELERIVTALDDEEVYVVTKTFIKYHRKAFTRILEYLNREGESA